MALITRVSRLFRADLHAVLDRIEEPDVLLKQAVREMEEELARGEQRRRVLRHEQDELQKRECDLDRSLAEISEQLDVCFESGKDDLARPLIKRKLESERLHRVLVGKSESLQETVADLNAHLKQNRAHMESMRQKLELLVADDAPLYPEENWNVPEVSVRDEDVEVAFLREKQKRSGS